MKKVYENTKNSSRYCINKLDSDYIIESVSYCKQNIAINIWIVPMTKKIFGIRNFIINSIRKKTLTKNLIPLPCHVPLLKHFYRYRIQSGRMHKKSQQIFENKLPPELSVMIADYSFFPPVKEN